MSSFWNWLVANGLYRDIISVVVVGILAPLVAYRPWKKHRATQKQIADSLDTSTPGGLTDVLRAVEANHQSGQNAGGQQS